MAVREVVKYPDPRLREDTFEVAEITDEIRVLVQDLIDTMFSLDAAGIAAIQIGRLERIFIIDGKVATGSQTADPLVFINPEIVETGKGEVVAEEGCLSFPEVFVDVKRPRWAKVRATNVAGETFEVDGDELFGRALQHEHDHLEGKLYVDRMTDMTKLAFEQEADRFLDTGFDEGDDEE